MIDIHIPYAVLIFQNFWSSRSMVGFQIITNCSVFDRLCFQCIVCLFWWLYGFIWWVYAIEKLEYNRYNKKQNMNRFYTSLIVVVCFLTLTDLTKFCWVLCYWSFQVLGYLMVDERRIEETMLGDAPASQAIIQEWETN